MHLDIHLGEDTQLALLLNAEFARVRYALMKCESQGNRASMEQIGMGIWHIRKGIPIFVKYDLH